MPIVKLRKRTRLDGEVRREQILNEALRIIAERGYNGFSIQELANRCGLTNAGLLHYFGSKDRLLIALLEDRDRRDAEAIASIAGFAKEIKTPSELGLSTVVKLLRAIVERNCTQPEIVRLYAVLRAEALNKAHPARDYFITRDAATLGVFAWMVTAHVREPLSTARQLLALMGGLEEQWLRVNQGFDLVAEWDRGVAQLLPRAGSGRARSITRRDPHRASLRIKE